jgi:hypothetical protein
MKFTLCLFLTLVHCLNAYRIVTLPKPDEEVKLKVYFSTKVVSQVHTVTSTVTQTAYATCYAAEPGIADCQNRRDTEESEPNVELNGEPTTWDSIISPSRTARVARQILPPDEIVEIVEPSENVQVIQPDLGEPAAVVYPTIVHQSREDEFILAEQKLEVPEIEPFEDEIEAITDKAEVRHHEHEIEDDDEDDEHDEHEHQDIEHEENEHEEDEHEEDEHEEDEHERDEHKEDEHGEDEHKEDAHEEDEHEHVSDDNSDSKFEDENQDEVVEPEVYSAEETTTFEPDFYEITTMIEESIMEEANPARENPDGPVVELESSWEEKEVVIKQNVNNGCMEMKNNNLFMNVMSTLISTLTEYEYTTVSGLNSVLFKSEGGCLPILQTLHFSSSCV